MNRRRGFTLIEMVVVVAIIAIAATMAVFYFGRQAPRARLDSTALELRALLLGARQQALASGSPVVVMVFPGFVTPGEGAGRFVMVEDRANTFFRSSAAVSFGDYDPAAPAAPDGGELLEVYDLPAPVHVGPADGLSSTPLPAPLVIDVDLDCGFCDTGTQRRGAIRFDSSGKVTFHAADGAALDLPVGASLSLSASDQPNQVRTLAVAAATGAVRSLSGVH